MTPNQTIPCEKDPVFLSSRSGQAKKKSNADESVRLFPRLNRRSSKSDRRTSTSGLPLLYSRGGAGGSLAFPQCFSNIPLPHAPLSANSNRLFSGQLPFDFTSICLAFSLAFPVRGRLMVMTPFLKVASICSRSASSGSDRIRWKEP